MSEKKITIFDVIADCKALEKLINEESDFETGEVREVTEEEKTAFLDWIMENEQNLETKFNNLYKVFRNLKAAAEVAEAEKNTLKAEMDRLGKRAKTRTNEAGRVKGLIEHAMVKLGFKKYKTALFSVGFQGTAKSAKPIEGFFNPDEIPVEFLNRELSPSAIKDAIKEGRLYEKDGAAYFTKLFYRDENGAEQMLKGVSYAGGNTMVIR